MIYMKLLTDNENACTDSFFYHSLVHNFNNGLKTSLSTTALKTEWIVLFIRIMTCYTNQSFCVILGYWPSEIWTFGIPGSVVKNRYNLLNLG